MFNDMQSVCSVSCVSYVYLVFMCILCLMFTYTPQVRAKPRVYVMFIIIMSK